MKLFRAVKQNIPNTITSMNLFSGCMAVVSAFHFNETIGAMQGYEWAFLFIGLATVFDFCDGLSARLLHAYSALGKELDSLSDLVSFGVAPAALVFNLIQSQTGSWVAFLAFLIAVFGALRLAKFNIDDRQTTSFIGLPIPANAIFWIGVVAWLAGAAVGKWGTFFVPTLMGIIVAMVVYCLGTLLIKNEKINPIYAMKMKQASLNK